MRLLAQTRTLVKKETMVHHHLLTYLVPGGPTQKFRSLVVTAPFAFYPDSQLIAVGSPTATYSCPHQECATTVKRLSKWLSPHCGVVSECQRLYRETTWGKFCAGYITINDEHVLTNERSGHFGHNWNDQNRLLLAQTFQEHQIVAAHSALAV